MVESIQLPPCPHCRCVRSEMIDVVERFGQTQDYRRCLNPNCRRYFSIEPTVAYDSDPVRIVCRNCSAKNPPVVRVVTRKNPEDPTVRYHKCERCGYTFKSVENPR